MTPWAVAHQAPLSLSFIGKNTGVGCHFQLQRISPIEGSSQSLEHWQADSLPLSHQGSPFLPSVQFSSVQLLSRVRLFATAWTVAHQASPSMLFSRQEYWSGLPFPSPRDLSDPGIEPGSPTLQADSLPSEPHLEVSQITSLA